MVKTTAYNKKIYGSKTKKVTPETKNIFDVTKKQVIAGVNPKMKPAKPSKGERRIGQNQRRKTGNKNYARFVTFKKVERGSDKVPKNIIKEKRKKGKKPQKQGFKLPF